MENSSLFNVVLFEPEIPPNTGNIVRTCVATHCHLHLIEPLGFDLSEKSLRRAGLDHWEDVKLSRYKNWDQWLSQVADHQRVFLFTTKTDEAFYDQNFQTGDSFVFGSETRGLPQSLLEKWSQQLVTIPINPQVRSLNLSNAVAIAVYQALCPIWKENKSVIN